jgi:Phage tail tube protein, GTA-gp10
VTAVANALRGEAMVAGVKLRPTFAALVAAEDELGPLFTLVERAAAGQLKLSDMVALFWHCRCVADDTLTRDAFAEQVMADGLAAATPALKILLGQILGGQ